MAKREAAQEVRRHSEIKSNLNLILYVLFITALSSLIALIIINYNLGKALSTPNSEKIEVDLTGEAAGGRQCMDKKDNDGDTFIDYPADPGCSSARDRDEINTMAQCDNGVDNDKDGLIDYPADPGCSSPLDSSELDDSCSDTDGGIVPEEKGKVTGALNGYYYTYIDNCYVDNSTTSTMLNEWYCERTAPFQTQISCASLGKRCVNGACV